jgi:8-oxo-dGTP pyrophosphatase MutT (NUDIX family)
VTKANKSHLSSDQLQTNRDTRYQGAIIRDHQILLLYGREDWGDGPSEFWLVPGGGSEPGESAEETVRREMLEETRLEVRVERLLLDRPPHSMDSGPYKRVMTYLCTPIGGEAAPGVEPEASPDEWVILDIGWFDLRNEEGWGKVILEDPITYDQLVAIRRELGYPSG